MPEAKVTIDLSKIEEQDFDAQRPLLIAAVKGGEIIARKTVVPGKEKDPRRITAQLDLGPAEDGVAGAEIVVAPADDERNVYSSLTARKFVTAAGERITEASIVVNAGIYAWWRFCWFPRSYRITGRLQRHSPDCAHPIAGAKVDILDVDYCWWWFREDVVTTGFTDVDGFFDIRFNWCVPIWCLFATVRQPLLAIDPDLRDRIRAALVAKVPIKWPPPPPPPDPWEWEKQLTELGVELPAIGRPNLAGLTMPAVRQVATNQKTADRSFAALPAPSALAPQVAAANTAASVATLSTAKVSATEIFRQVIFWPPCDEPCDWLPDIKIRVTQAQPGGPVVIYEDTWAQIHFNQAGDILNLTLEANASAMYADCPRDPILGNCMLLDAVGTFKIMPSGSEQGVYQPDVTPGVSYGVTPDRPQRLGYTKESDRPWARTVSVYGRFGIAANVDYYQVQVASWTNADLTAWSLDHTHVPPDSAFAPVPGTALPAFSRSYLEESPAPNHWPSETFGPNTVSGIPLLYKSRERFEQEYRNTHGGADPAPSFGGWYWYYFTETRLFDLDTSKMPNGYYTFRFVGYRQTGVDGSGNPILTPTTMLPGGVGRRCNTALPELVTLYLHDDKFIPECAILTFTKHGPGGSSVVDECAMVTLTPADWLEVEYEAFDAAGNLGSYSTTLQKGFSSPHNLIGLAGVTAISGSVPEGPTYADALVDPSPAVPPYWYGGIWRKKISYSAFVAMGGSCAYNLRVTACDRHTNGFSSSCSLGYCDENRAFTIILA
jgi:hypothetical protein